MMRLEMSATLVGIFLSMPAIYLVTTNVWKTPNLIETAGAPLHAVSKDSATTTQTIEDHVTIDINILLNQGNGLFEPSISQIESTEDQTKETHEVETIPLPILIGTMIEAGSKKALITIPGSEPSYELISIGETIGVFTLVDVTNDQITLNNMDTGNTEVVLILRE